MRPESEWKGNALILLSALGVGALYGGVTGLVLWLLNFPDAAEIGGFVSTATGGLALLVALFMIIHFAPNRPFGQPMSWLERAFVWLSGIALCVLIAIPFVARTLGQFLRRIFSVNTPREEKAH